jgi:hypothetical protein
MRSAGANESIRHSLFFEVTDNGKDFLRIAKRVLEALECEGVQVKTAVSAKELTLFMEAAIVDDVYLPEDVFAYTSVPYAEIRLGRSIVTKKPKFE